MKRPSRIVGVALLILIGFGDRSPAQPKLRIAGIFGDKMVLQRAQPARIWGWADKEQQVTIRFAGQTASATANDDGTWQITLEPLKASKKGRDLLASCNSERVHIRNVVVGDVWHASGQSNMAMTVGAAARRLPQARKDIDAAKLPAIRFRRIRANGSEKPQDDLPTEGGWIVSSPTTAPGFSAAAFYFARKLHKELDVPIGVIDSSRGGTPIEPYIPRASFQSHPTLRRELELADQNDLRGIRKLPGGVRARDENWLPGRLFHSRLAPVTRFAVRGSIWYQGESNCGAGEDPRDYEHKLRALVSGWRQSLGNEALPFYFVQLPGSGARAGWPYLREQQRLCTDLPNTGMVVTIDLLDDNIHPPNKIDVGERLARWALANEYQMTIPYSGPLFERAKITGQQVAVHFSHAESGLMVATKDGLADAKESPQKTLSHFELADKTGKWQPAEAVIAGHTVIVRSEDLLDPVAVRYAYAVNPRDCNLYNRDGLPASPFCSETALLNFVPDLPND